MTDETLLWRSPYQREMLTTIINAEGNKVLFETTCFYPGGGGQPHDTGTLFYKDEQFEIVEVFKDETGKIWHKIKSDKKIDFEKGTNVLIKVNWPRRYALMKAHTGQHLISHFLKKLFNVDTLKANFFEDGMIEIELSKLITKEQLEEALLEANKKIVEGVAVESIIVDQETFQKEYIDKVRGKKSKEQTLRMIKLGDFDLVCCGGLHVKNLTEIGGLFFDELKKTKCKLLVGLKGIQRANQNSFLLSIIEDITTKKDQQLIKFVKNKMFAAEQLGTVTTELLKMIFSHPEVFGEKNNDYTLLFLELNVERNILLAAAKELSPNSLIIVNTGKLLYILSSTESVLANDLTRKLTSALNTKGGGNQRFAQLTLNQQSHAEIKKIVKEMLTTI